VKKGIPPEILEELNIEVVEKPKKEVITTAIVEKHQVKLPIPSQIRRELEISKGQKLTVNYNPKTKTLTYKLK